MTLSQSPTGAASHRAGWMCPLLMNAKAGAFRHHAGAGQVQQLARDLELNIEVVATHSRDEMLNRLREAVRQNAPCIAVAGGDGTIALAVQELAQTQTALGIVPQGTANNFATALRLPHDLPSALRVVGQGTVRRVDLGLVEVGQRKRYFTESAGIGLFADALSLYGAGTNKNIPRALWAIAKLFFSARARRVRLTLDNEQVTERAVMVEAANSFRMAYAVPLAPDAKLTDGVLDLVVLGDLERNELFSYYKAIRAQVHKTLPKVEMHQTKVLKIESRHVFPVHCDDRVIGQIRHDRPAVFRAIPKALPVLVEAI
jgi:diacylglycerol kinase family enzyme